MPRERMTLGAFITANAGPIITEWEAFAATQLPAAHGMSVEQRRDHVAGILASIALDLGTPQSERQQADKSKGKDDAAAGSKTAANSHGSDRAAVGYTPGQMMSEFRALRASVLRLWTQSQDDSDRERLEELTRFNESIDQELAESTARFAEAIEKAKDVFLGILGHDLRTPLGAVVMSARMMARKEPENWPHARAVSRILQSGARMDAMIGDLVDFTRSRLGGGLTLTRTQIDMEAVCRHAVEELVAFHPGCKVSFEASGDLDGAWDGPRVAQVLSNLLGNAYQHGAEGAPVQVRLRGEPGEVTLTVRNEGPMIPENVRQEIFSPFRRVSTERASARSDRSLGLGLYIVHSIVAAHGGKIDFESTAAGGTTFSVRLPRTTA